MRQPGGGQNPGKKYVAVDMSLGGVEGPLNHLPFSKFASAGLPAASLDPSCPVAPRVGPPAEVYSKYSGLLTGSNACLAV